MRLILVSATSWLNMLRSTQSSQSSQPELGGQDGVRSSPLAPHERGSEATDAWRHALHPFEGGTLDRSDWIHRAHVQMAYIYYLLATLAL